MADLIVTTAGYTFEAGTHTYDKVHIQANANISGTVVIQAHTFIVDAGVTVSGFARGYAGGAASANGQGPGAGKYNPYSGGGGSYGGRGGDASASGTQYGATYGTSTGTDIDAGSGGGGGYLDAGGGAGGAALHVDASIIEVHGTINVNGASAYYGSYGGGGGGAGGGILFVGDNIWVDGTLSANGGAGHLGYQKGGGGGGGRIKVFYGTAITMTTATKSYSGGTGNITGDSGTYHEAQAAYTPIVPLPPTTTPGLSDLDTTEEIFIDPMLSDLDTTERVVEKKIQEWPNMLREDVIEYSDGFTDFDTTEEVVSWQMDEFLTMVDVVQAGTASLSTTEELMLFGSDSKLTINEEVFGTAGDLDRFANTTVLYDGYVSSGSPNSVFDKDQTISVYIGSGQYKGVVVPNLDINKNWIITKAELMVYVSSENIDNLYVGYTSSPVDLVAGETWNSMPTISKEKLLSSFYGFQWASIDVTDYYNEMRDGNKINHAFVLRTTFSGGTTEGRQLNFRSMNNAANIPYIKLTYQTPVTEGDSAIEMTEFVSATGNSTLEVNESIGGTNDLSMTEFIQSKVVDAVSVVEEIAWNGGVAFFTQYEFITDDIHFADMERSIGEMTKFYDLPVLADTYVSLVDPEERLKYFRVAPEIRFDRDAKRNVDGTFTETRLMYVVPSYTQQQVDYMDGVYKQEMNLPPGEQTDLAILHLQVVGASRMEFEKAIREGYKLPPKDYYEVTNGRLDGSDTGTEAETHKVLWTYETITDKLRFPKPQLRGQDWTGFDAALEIFLHFEMNGVEESDYTWEQRKAWQAIDALIKGHNTPSGYYAHITDEHIDYANMAYNAEHYVPSRPRSGQDWFMYNEEEARQKGFAMWLDFDFLLVDIPLITVREDIVDEEDYDGVVVPIEFTNDEFTNQQAIEELERYLFYFDGTNKINVTQQVMQIRYEDLFLKDLIASLENGQWLDLSDFFIDFSNPDVLAAYYWNGYDIAGHFDPETYNQPDSIVVLETLRDVVKITSRQKPKYGYSLIFAGSGGRFYSIDHPDSSKRPFIRYYGPRDMFEAWRHFSVEEVVKEASAPLDVTEMVMESRAILTTEYIECEEGYDSVDVVEYVEFEGYIDRFHKLPMKYDSHVSNHHPTLNYNPNTFFSVGERLDYENRLGNEKNYAFLVPDLSTLPEDADIYVAELFIEKNILEDESHSDWGKIRTIIARMYGEEIDPAVGITWNTMKFTSPSMSSYSIVETNIKKLYTDDWQRLDVTGMIFNFLDAGKENGAIRLESPHAYHTVSQYAGTDKYPDENPYLLVVYRQSADAGREELPVSEHVIGWNRIWMVERINWYYQDGVPISEYIYTLDTIKVELPVVESVTTVSIRAINTTEVVYTKSDSGMWIYESVFEGSAVDVNERVRQYEEKDILNYEYLSDKPGEHLVTAERVKAATTTDVTTKERIIIVGISDMQTLETLSNGGKSELFNVETVQTTAASMKTTIEHVKQLVFYPEVSMIANNELVVLSQEQPIDMTGRVAKLRDKVMKQIKTYGAVGSFVYARAIAPKGKLDQIVGVQYLAASPSADSNWISNNTYHDMMEIYISVDYYKKLNEWAWRDKANTNELFFNHQGDWYQVTHMTSHDIGNEKVYLKLVIQRIGRITYDWLRIT